MRNYFELLEQVLRVIEKGPAHGIEQKHFTQGDFKFHGFEFDDANKTIQNLIDCDVLERRSIHHPTYVNMWIKFTTKGKIFLSKALPLNPSYISNKEITPVELSKIINGTTNTNWS